MEAEWGESPGLAPDVAGKWTKSMARAARWARSVPAAACIAMVVILGVMLNGNGQAYGWASMMQALAERGIIQVEDENGSRWLALSGRRHRRKNIQLDATDRRRAAGCSGTIRRSF